MTERQLLQDLTKQMKIIPDLYWYKIPDTFGGHKKPFDVFAIYRGKPLAIEFKKTGGRLEVYQRESLSNVISAGGLGFIAEFIKGPRHERDIMFQDYSTYLRRSPRYLKWQSGKYVNIEYFLNTLLSFVPQTQQD